MSQRQELKDLSNVGVFLEAIGKNSRKTRNNYENALVHLERYVSETYPQQSINSILPSILDNKIDIYKLMDDFVTYETRKEKGKITPQSLRTYLIGIRSYFAYFDIDIIPSKFKRKVKVPRVGREDEEPIDARDIRRILLSCNNRRLKAYLLILASGGMRAVEGLAIRLRDIDFSSTPTRIHIRKEYSKTRVARDIYISDEATTYLKQWLDWKYREKRYNTRKSDPSNLIFRVYKVRSEPESLYPKILQEFEALLKVVGLDERKEGMKRRKITLHTLRRFTKTVISDQTNQDYSEWFLGHAKSPYYTKKEPEKREIYSTKCMKYLTFLDYTTLEATGKSIEAKISEKDMEIAGLKTKYDTDIALLKEAVSDMQQLLKNPEKLVEISKPSIQETFQ